MVIRPCFFNCRLFPTLELWLRYPTGTIYGSWISFEAGWKIPIGHAGQSFYLYISGYISKTKPICHWLNGGEPVSQFTTNFQHHCIQRSTKLRVGCGYTTRNKSIWQISRMVIHWDHLASNTLVKYCVIHPPLVLKGTPYSGHRQAGSTRNHIRPLPLSRGYNINGHGTKKKTLTYPVDNYRN